MTLFRRLVAWLLFLGVLTVIGGGVFHWVRYRPRFLLDGRRVQHVSVDGRWLATLRWSTDLTEDQCPLEVWDTYTGKLARSFDVTMPVALSPDGRYFYCDTVDDRVCFIDWQRGATWTPPCEAHTVACDFSPKGRWFCARSSIIDVGKRQVCWSPEGTLIGFTGDDRYAICHDQNKLVTVHDPATGARLRTLDVKLARSQTAGLLAPAESMPAPFVHDFGSFQFSHDGRWVIHFIEMDLQTLFAGANGMPASQFNTAVVSMPSKGFELWDVETGKRPLRIESSLYQRPSVLVSPDGKHIAVWDESRHSSGEVALYDTTGTNLFSVRRGDVWGAQFTTDGTRLLLIRNNGEMGRADEITMLDVATGRVLWDADSCEDIFFGVDGNVLQAKDTGTLHLLDARTGQVRRTLATGLILSHFNTLTPDGRHAALGGRYFQEQNSLEDFLAKWLPAVFSDKKDVILVADMATGKVRLRLRNADIEETLLTLSDDGGTLVTMQDGEPLTIEVWDVDPHRAWLWAFVTAVALGLIALTYSRWRARIRSAATKG